MANYNDMVYSIQLCVKGTQLHDYSSSLSTELMKRTIAGGRLSSLMEKIKCCINVSGVLKAFVYSMLKA